MSVETMKNETELCCQNKTKTAKKLIIYIHNNLGEKRGKSVLHHPSTPLDCSRAVYSTKYIYGNNSIPVCLQLSK